MSVKQHVGRSRVTSQLRLEVQICERCVTSQFHSAGRISGVLSVSYYFVLLKLSYILHHEDLYLSSMWEPSTICHWVILTAWGFVTLLKHITFHPKVVAHSGGLFGVSTWLRYCFHYYWITALHLNFSYGVHHFYTGLGYHYLLWWFLKWYSLVSFDFCFKRNLLIFSSLFVLYIYHIYMCIIIYWCGEYLEVTHVFWLQEFLLIIWLIYTSILYSIITHRFSGALLTELYTNGVCGWSYRDWQLYPLFIYLFFAQFLTFIHHFLSSYTLGSTFVFQTISTVRQIVF